jgi:hypothetical protein
MRSLFPFWATVNSMVARLVKIVLGSLGLVLYTWFAAVRSLPRVRAGKAARRAARRASET